MILFIRRISTMTAPSTSGTEPPRKWGGPELTGTSGAFCSLAHLTICCSSSVFAGSTTHLGAFPEVPGLMEYSCSLPGPSRTCSLPTIFSSSISIIQNLLAARENMAALLNIGCRIIYRSAINYQVTVFPFLFLLTAPMGAGYRTVSASLAVSAGNTVFQSATMP